MTRKKSYTHAQLHTLSRRSHLDETQLVELEKLRIGFEGEQTFDQVIQSFVDTHHLIHIKDLLFQYDGRQKEIQIDNIVISNDTCYIFEIKKYSFNVRIDDRGFFYYEDGMEFTSLNNQIERLRGSVRELLKNVGYPMKIKHYLVFINPDRTVFGLQRQHQVLIHTTLNHFLKNHMQRNRDDYSYLIAAIDDYRIPYSKHIQLYDLDLEHLARGVYCNDCDGRMARVSKFRFQCRACNSQLTTLEAVQMLIQEVKSLNHEFKISSRFLSKLSGGEISSSTIRKYHSLNQIKY